MRNLPLAAFAMAAAVGLMACGSDTTETAEASGSTAATSTGTAGGATGAGGAQGGGGAGGSSAPAAGPLDTTFGTAGIVMIDRMPGSEEAWALVVQPDGKIVVAGHAFDPNAGLDFLVVRLNPDGALDPSFAAGGVLELDLGGHDAAYGMALQPDGRIVVVGQRTSGTTDTAAIVRLEPSGAIDQTFGPSGGILLDDRFSFARGVVVRPDGRLVVVGNGVGGWVLASYATTGSVDAAFGTAGIAAIPVCCTQQSASAIALQSDGKLLVTGSTWNGGQSNLTFRLDSNGAPDATFNGDGHAYPIQDHDCAYGRAIALQPNGQSIVAGSVDCFVEMAATRYTVDGTLDMGFGTKGTALVDVGVAEDQSYGIAVQSDGKIVLGGYTGISVNNSANQADLLVARLETNGTLDASFGNMGSVTTNVTPGLGDFGLALALQSDGKILLAGYTTLDGTTLNDGLLVARYWP